MGTKLQDALWQDPVRMSGAVCFRGTRIPVSILFDYLHAGDLAGFVEGCPDVTREMVDTVLTSSQRWVEAEVAKRRTA